MATDDIGNTRRTADKETFQPLRPKPTRFRGTVGGSDPGDFFRTRLRHRSSVELSLTNLRENANLEFLERDGTLVKRSAKRGTNDEAINVTVDPGVYFIHVQGTRKETRYTLSATGNRDRFGDNLNTATVVEVNNGRNVFKDYVGPSDRSDFLQFTTGGGSPRQLVLRLNKLSSNANLALFDSDGKIISRSNKSGTSAERIKANLDPNSTYSVRVFSARKNTPGTTYRLLANLKAIPDRAGNTRDDAARPITLPAFSDSFTTLDTELLDINDIDVYRFVAPDEPTALDLRLSGLSADADLFLYEEGGTTPIASSTRPGTDNEIIRDVVLTPGQKYYIEVRPFDNNTFTFFTLSARTKTGIIDMAGNSPEEARDINLDSDWRFGQTGPQGPIDPSLYSDAVGSFDLDDYYVFSLNQASFLSLKADISRGSANLQLIAADGSTVLDTVDGTDATAPKIEGVFNQGTYYARVSPVGTEPSSAFYQLNLAGESVELRPAFVKDINVGPDSSAVPGKMVNIGGLLYFAANDGVNGVQLWRTDGTGIDGSLNDKAEDGTERLTNSPFTSISNLTVANIGGTNVIFFAGRTADAGTELWRWDAVNGASLVKDISPGSTSSDVGVNTGIVALNNRIFFGVAEREEGASDEEPGILNLWTSDGTEAGTQRVEISGFSLFGTVPENLTVVGDKLYLTAFDDSAQQRLFMIDVSGGNVNVTQVAGQNDLNAGTINNLTNVNGRLYFTASGAAVGGSDRGNELWRLSDTGEVEELADIVPGAGGAIGISNLTVLGNTVYFTANDNASGSELWQMVIDPTTGDTTVSLAADINTTATNAGSNPQQLTVVNGQLYFIANDGINGSGLWRYDPAAAMNPASLVEFEDNGSFNPVAFNFGVSPDSTPGSLIAVGDFLYFKASREATGSELWRVSPLLGGLAEELDLLPGEGSSSPSDFTEVNGRLFFRATDGSTTDESVGRELWVVGLPQDNLP
jgi:ELWxxDGT repeat protein